MTREAGEHGVDEPETSPPAGGEPDRPPSRGATPPLHARLFAAATLRHAALRSATTGAAAVVIASPLLLLVLVIGISDAGSGGRPGPTVLESLGVVLATAAVLAVVAGVPAAPAALIERSVRRRRGRPAFGPPIGAGVAAAATGALTLGWIFYVGAIVRLGDPRLAMSAILGAIDETGAAPRDAKMADALVAFASLVAGYGVPFGAVVWTRTGGGPMRVRSSDGALRATIATFRALLPPVFGAFMLSIPLFSVVQGALGLDAPPSLIPVALIGAPAAGALFSIPLVPTLWLGATAADRIERRRAAPGAASAPDGSPSRR